MAVEDVIPSVRRGKKLIDTVMSVKDADGKPRFSNMDEFQRFLQKSGMPMIGQTGGEASLELLNSMVEPKDRYIKISPDYQKMEEATLKTKSAKIKKVEGPKTAQQILTISAEAESKFPGKMTNAKKSFIERALKQANIFIDDAAKLGFKSLLGATGPIGATIAATIELATAPKAEAKEVMQKRSLEDEIRARLQEQGFGQTGPSLLTQMQNDPQNIGMANGGMMNINDMITPVGYKIGTRKGNLVGDKEKVIKVGLMEDVGDLSTLTKRLLLKKSLVDYGGRDALQKMDDLDKMSPVEIEIEFQKLMGVEES